jgi:putative transposase
LACIRSFANEKRMCKKADRLRKNVASGRVNFQRNLPLWNGFCMKRKRFAVEQLVAACKEAEVETPVADLIRRIGITKQTFYRWKKQYAGLARDQARQLKQLQEDIERLKKIIAEVRLDKAMLADVIEKRWCKRLRGARSWIDSRTVISFRAACLSFDWHGPKGL